MTRNRRKKLRGLHALVGRAFAGAAEAGARWGAARAGRGGEKGWDMGEEGDRALDAALKLADRAERLCLSRPYGRSYYNRVCARAFGR